MKDNLTSHFDKLLLTFLIMVFAVCAFRGFQIGSVGLETFGSDTTKLFAGALLTLITGSVLRKNGTPPADPKPTPDQQPDPTTIGGIKA